jgi:Flp pilus assembly pilin Flp
MNRFRRIAGKNSLVKDDRGLSTVEYVIILVLIAAASVGIWKTLGETVKSKIGSANTEIGSIKVKAEQG